MQTLEPANRVCLLANKSRFTELNREQKNEKKLRMNEPNEFELIKISHLVHCRNIVGFV